MSKKKFVTYTGLKYGGHNDLEVALTNLFRVQGVFYEKVMGVSWDDARRAGWHPEDRDFDDDCEGWKAFLESKGQCEIHSKILYDDYDMGEIKNIVQACLLNLGGNDNGK